MKKRTLIGGVFVLISFCIAVVLHGNAHSTQPVPNREKVSVDSLRTAIPTIPDPVVQGVPPEKPSPAVKIPDHVFYGEMFSLVVALDNFYDYQQQANLTNDQTVVFEQIAKDCQNKIADHDARAQVLIAALREKWLAKYRSGDPMPPVPPEIDDLQRAREAQVFRCRNQLRRELGEEAFARLTATARTIVQINFASGQPN